MKKMWLVIKYEITATLSRPSFLFFIFGVPLLILLIMGVVSIFNSGSDTAEVEETPEMFFENATLQGFVDQSGIIKEIPTDFPEQVFRYYESEALAEEALKNSDISGYLIVSEDYIDTGEILFVSDYINPFSPTQYTYLLKNLITYNLLDRDIEKVQLFWNAMLVEPYVSPEEAAAVEEERTTTEEEFNLNSIYFVSYGFMMGFYIVILMSSSLFLNNIGNEKKNRSIEVLLSSVKPAQLLYGKFIGQGIVGLLQISMYLLTGLLVVNVFDQVVSLPTGFELPISVIFWGVIFFLFGYALYGSLTGAMGVLAPTSKEASQMIFIVIAPLIIPMMLSPMIINHPNNTISTILGLFPLTSPIAMMTRIPTLRIPWWEIVLSALVLLGTALVVMRAAANLFRAQILLSGKSFNIKRYFAALFGKYS